MANSFQRGDTITFLWSQAVVAADQLEAAGGAIGGPNQGVAAVPLTPIVLGIKTHNIDMECLRHDVSNTKHAGGKARWPGQLDAKATVTASMDRDEMPHSFNIFPGIHGVMLLGTTASPLSQGVEIPCIVAKLHYESSVETEVRWSFDVEYSVLAGHLLVPGT